MSELAVWFLEQQVGLLSLNAGHLSFQYDANWVTNPSSMPISCSLPLQQESFADGQCRPFFAGLLPEGRLRRLIARHYHVSGQNDFALLDAIGGECAGAITFLPVGESLVKHDKSQHVEWLSEQSLIELLDELPHRPMLAGEDGIRLSLAGAQDKLPVVFDGKQIGLPKQGYPSTHILKPAIPSVDDSVLNEGFCLALARSLNLPSVDALIYPVLDKQALLVRRYDRNILENKQIIRVHQEDFCQALGVLPEEKYQNEGGPTLSDCFELLRKNVRPSAPQVLQFLDNVIFNALVGNHDAHAKNFSFIYLNGKTILAPLYDVVSTAVYSRLTPKMAMKLGGKYKFTEVHSKHWDSFAEEVGLSKAEMRKRALTLARGLPSAAKLLQAKSELFSTPIIDKIVTLIEQRSSLTSRRLTEDNKN